MEQSASSHITPYILWLIAFARTVNRWKQDWESSHLIIGCPVSGRPYSHLENLIGYFLNNIILIIPTANISFQNVKKSFDDAIAYQDVPFHLLVSKIQQNRVANLHPIFQIYFNFRQNLDFPKVEIEGLGTSVDQLTMNRIFEFSCTIDELKDGTYRVLYEYNPKLFKKDTISSFGNDYLNDLCNLVGLKKSSKTDFSMQIFEFPKFSIYKNLLYQSSLTPHNIAITYPNGSIENYSTLIQKIEFYAQKVYLWHFSTTGTLIHTDDVIPGRHLFTG